MIEKITSPQNPGVKRVARLRVKKGRDAKHLTIVEGVREVRQALAAGLRFSGAYVCSEGVYRCPPEIVGELESAGIRVNDTTCTVFDKLAYGDRTEGVLALVEPAVRSLADLKLRDNPLIVVLESVEKPGNLGAVLRTCDGAGVDALIVCDERTDIYNPNVVRSSLGTIFSVPTVSCAGREAADFLAERGITTYAAVVQAEQFYYDKDWRRPCAIVLGSEQDGLSDFWLRNANEKVRIPMLGRVDSLNVSVSAAVMIYEAVRQRALGANMPGGGSKGV
ncbi:MAG: RNA methyltransferase [Candidatus Omnitrophica bacterium]|nr:RNA methyltransferase [Candidatus Omnitrophota bacterium]